MSLLYSYLILNSSLSTYSCMSTCSYLREHSCLSLCILLLVLRLLPENIIECEPRFLPVPTYILLHDLVPSGSHTTVWSYSHTYSLLLSEHIILFFLLNTFIDFFIKLFTTFMTFDYQLYNYEWCNFFATTNTGKDDIFASTVRHCAGVRITFRYKSTDRAQ